MDFTFECTNCGKNIHPSGILYLCPDCSKKQQPDIPPLGVLKTIYDYTSLSKKLNKDFSLQQLLENFLPLKSLSSMPPLKIGNTPVYSFSKSSSSLINKNLFFKDDSQHPTYSFKDRASALVSAFAHENGISEIIAASTGNAGSSLAGICASHQQKAVIFVPAAAPLAKLTQIVMYGATIVPVKGTYDDAFDLSVQMTEKYGFYNRNTAFNPMTIEGKKTVSFEIFDFFRKGLPDFIFVPVGDGVIISGVYKGFEDLLKTGLIEKIPVIVAVQAEGSSNLIRNISSEHLSFTPSQTIADSISVDIPRNFYMAEKYIRLYKGLTVSVSDNDILEASVHLSKNTGLFSEPAAAAAFAGFVKLSITTDLIKYNQRSLILLTGSGLKDLNSIRSKIKIPEAIEPDSNAPERVFQFIRNRKECQFE